MMSDLLKVVDDSRERSPAIDWSTIADSNNWRFTSVFIPFLADYYLQSNSLEVSIVYLPHALAQLSAFLKCMNMLPAESEGYQWMTGQCRWVLLYLAKIYAILRDNYLLRTVPTLSGSLQSIAGLWEPKGLMSWRSGWFREVSAIDQHKIMVCGWLVPLIMTDANIAVTEASFAPIGFTEIAATHPAVVSRISPSSTSCAENSSCPPQSSSYLLSSWVYGLLDTLPPVRVDTETSAKLSTVEYPSPDALKHAESVNEFLWNFFFDKDGPLNRMQVDESISSKARKILADKCSSEDEGVMAVVLAHLLREPTLIKLVGNSADCVCVLSGTVLAHFHKSFSNENPRRSESFILVHTLILSLLLESGRRDDNEIASINCLISLFIARGMPDNTCDASADGKGISSSAAAMLLNYYITSLVVVIVSIDHMLRTANCHGNIDYALYKLYQKTVSILHSIQYMKPLRGICSFNSLSNDLKPNFDYDSLFSDIIHGGTRIRSALSLETLTGVNIWDTLKLDAYSKAYFESSNSLLDINSLPLKDMFMLSLLLASPVQVIEMQNFVGWKAACGESTSLSFTLAASVASRLQVAPNMLQYFLSAMQSMTLDSLPSSESLMSLSHETRPSKSVANPSQQKLDLTRKCMKCLSVSDFDKSKISSQLQKFDFDISEQIMAYSRGFHRNSHELLDKIRSCVSDLEMPSLLTNFHALVNQFVGHIVGQCVFYCQYSAYIEKGSYNAPGNKGKNRY